MGIYMHQHRLPRKGRGAGICLKYYCECGAFTVIRQELTARDFDSAESIEIEEILCVFSNFSAARMRQKARCSAADE